MAAARASTTVVGRRGEHRCWAALGLVTAAEIGLVGATVHFLTGWPGLLGALVAASVPLVAAAALAAWGRLDALARPALVRAIEVTGSTALVTGLFALVAIELGRAPTDGERTVFALSLAAAAASVILYAPVRSRVALAANRLAYGTRQAPAEVLQTFGARLSRAVPLEELLLQLVESLRASLDLAAAEVWTCGAGRLERSVSDPERGAAAIAIEAHEESVIVRAGVSGRARVEMWLPGLLAGRGDALVGVAPIASAGELLGLLVAERPAGAPPFDDEAETVLAQLGRQVGLALRNVRLDSELEASLDALRRQADELRSSRARLVAAADSERRRIERDLHDGAQQHLVGLAVNLRVARALVDTDPDRAKAILDELRTSAQAAMEDFRALAHGIYPPLLEDRGLCEALGSAARRAGLPVRVDAVGLGRYAAGVEATVYFCCVEALQNAAKHAGAGARAAVRVWQDGASLRFEVSDDGRGVDAARRAGVGLTSMRDRLGAVGGALLVESSRGKGTRVAGVIPAPRDRAGPPSRGG